MSQTPNISIRNGVSGRMLLPPFVMLFLIVEFAGSEYFLEVIKLT